MIFVCGRIELEPAHTDAFIEAISAIIETTRKEKGCTIYAIARDVVQSNVLWISEEWETEEDLAAHLATPHVADFLAKVSSLTIRSMDARKYQVSSVSPMGIPES